MSEFTPTRPVHTSVLPSEREWERSAVLEPRPAARHPELISDGGGLPFPPAVLGAQAQPLDPEDGAAKALLAHLVRSAPKPPLRAPWKRGAAPVPASASASLEGWRVLARTEREVLFARGRPPELLTVAFRKDRLLRSWTHAGSNKARPLRVMREGIRASSWRPDPTQALQSQVSELRVLVTEQAFASGQRAEGRVLAPDLYVDEDELVLTMFVTPRPGFQTGAPNPETPVRIALAHPLGERRLIDGALARFLAPEAAPPARDGSDAQG